MFQDSHSDSYVEILIAVDQSKVWPIQLMLHLMGSLVNGSGLSVSILIIGTPDHMGLSLLHVVGGPWQGLQKRQMSARAAGACGANTRE